MGVDGDRVLRRVARRLLPLLVVLYVVSFVDRVNIGVAALRMNADLHLSASAYGLASGIFFIGYLAFQVPANLAFHRLGARVWLSLLLIAWGSCSAATAFVTGAHSLYVARLALGITEAGLFPAVICYLGNWFPQQWRARTTAMFLLAIPVANIIGAPVSGLLVEHGAIGGFAGWRTMFLTEGLPAVLLSPLVWWLLPEGPLRARWLDSAERDWLVRRLTPDEEPSYGLAAALLQPRLFALAAINAGVAYALYSLQFFLPQFVASLRHGSSAVAATAVVAACYVIAAVAMAAWSRRTDRADSPARHLALPPLIGSATLTAVLVTRSPTAILLGIGVGLACALPAVPAFWSLAARLLTGGSGLHNAVGVAALNAVASLSGFIGPYLTGRLKDATGGYTAGLGLIAASLAITGLGASAIHLSARARTAS